MPDSIHRQESRAGSSGSEDGHDHEHHHHGHTEELQKGLVQSIGKPFDRNHAKLLPEPGEDFQVSRRISQIRLRQISMLGGDVAIKRIFGLANTLKFYGLLIGVCGLCFLAFLLIVAGWSSPFEYSKHFLDKYPVCTAIHLVGVIQPIGVGSYCRFALIDLALIRSYYLRVPILLISPLAVAACGAVQLVAVVDKDIKASFHNYLQARMHNYFKTNDVSIYSKVTWDEIQNNYDCCGFTNQDDWKKSMTGPRYPISCCAKQTRPCDGNNPSLRKRGCILPLATINVIAGLVYLVLALIIIIFEVMSVLCMRSLHKVIRKQVYDERVDIEVVFGNICSLCAIPETDDEMGFDEHLETSQTDNDKWKEENKKSAPHEPDKTSDDATSSTPDNRGGTHGYTRSSKVAPAP